LDARIANVSKHISQTSHPFAGDPDGNRDERRRPPFEGFCSHPSKSTCPEFPPDVDGEIGPFRKSKKGISRLRGGKTFASNAIRLER